MKINLCCGMDYRSGYVNVDFSNLGSDSNPIKVDLKANILEGLPFADNSADEIIFRESLEHFNRWNGIKVLEEIYRVLDFAGVLDLTVPPAKQQMMKLLLWMDRPCSWSDFIDAHERFTYWKWHDDLLGATHFSDGKDGDSHKTLWTPQALRAVLEHVGFSIQSIDSNIHVKATK